MAEQSPEPLDREAVALPAESLHTVFRLDPVVRAFNFRGITQLEAHLQKQLGDSLLDADSKVKIFHGFETGSTFVAFESADHDDEQAMGRHATHLWTSLEDQTWPSDELIAEVRSVESHRLALNGIESVWPFMRDLTPHYQDLEEARMLYSQDIEISDFL